MATLSGLFIFLIPLLALAFISSREYGLSMGDSFDKWRAAKVIAIGIAILYWLIILFVWSEADRSSLFNEWDLEGLLSYYFFPGLNLGLVIFAHAAGEMYAARVSVSSSEICEDAAFVLGYLGLIFCFSFVFY
ncbi:hypothetical protein L2750_15350 [Shewanella submarina]|uniref:Uncharacterized protein n=1 Tax=Shewanella submarina TaxID=2016376 RepID=A0ABV7G910_9GAMM|nr:hypothetical protein [Shewanella submarina]MCL1038509.1 hypothetical protein [Shewanella submarina]